MHLRQAYISDPVQALVIEAETELLEPYTDADYLAAVTQMLLQGRLPAS